METASIAEYEYPEGAIETDEYSVYGWFKYKGDLSATDKFTLIRMTNNEKTHLKDSELLGDRTLVA